MTDLEIIGVKIKLYREQKNMTQYQLAEAVDISVSHMSDIENGKKEMGIGIFRRIVSILQVDANALLDLTYDVSKCEKKERIVSLIENCDIKDEDVMYRCVTYFTKIVQEIKEHK